MLVAGSGGYFAAIRPNSASNGGPASVTAFEDASTSSNEHHQHSEHIHVWSLIADRTPNGQSRPVVTRGLAGLRRMSYYGNTVV